MSEPAKSQAALRPYVEVVLAGQLTARALEKRLNQASASLASGTARGVLVDCLAMSGYDHDARESFVLWNRREKSRIARLAVVTDRAMWHLVVSGMALASGGKLKAFNQRLPAIDWLADI